MRRGVELNVNTNITLDAKNFLGFLQQFERQAPRAIERGIRSGVGLMVRHVTKEKLRGQYLHRRTGTLIRSITASPRFEVTENVIRGTFGSHLDYARYHEEGFSGPITVPAHVQKAHQRGPYTVRPHSRRTKRGGVSQVRGHAVRRHSVAAHQVRQHIAVVNIRARHFLRDSVDEKSAEAIARVRRALILLKRTGQVPTLSALGGS